jgi:hypothetical protein
VIADQRAGSFRLPPVGLFDGRKTCGLSRDLVQLPLCKTGVEAFRVLSEENEMFMEASLKQAGGGRTPSAHLFRLLLIFR